MMSSQALWEASVCCRTMYTIVPRIGPSIVPSPPMITANAISAVHCTLNAALGCTPSWLMMYTPPAAQQQVHGAQREHAHRQPGPVGVGLEQRRADRGQAWQRRAGAAAERGEPL